MKAKALQKGLIQLAEEGAVQVFTPVNGSGYILGAVGALQFDVILHRLRDEYGVEGAFESVNFGTARWIHAKDPKAPNAGKELERFQSRSRDNLAIDGEGRLTYLADSVWSLKRVQEAWPEIEFRTTEDLA
jgi:peptide chain release factor 3